MRTPSQRQKDRLDRLFREFIRKRAIQRVGGCERCLTGKTTYKQLQTSHFVGRTSLSVRWNEDNAVGLCGGCHMYLEHHPIEHVEFAKKILGEKYDLLQARMRDTSKIDKELIELYLKRKIEEVK